MNEEVTHLSVRQRIGIAVAAIVTMVGALLLAGPVSDASALANRLDNWSGRTITMHSGWASENVPNGSAGYQVQKWYKPANACVRVTYRNGYARNWSGSGGFWVTTLNYDGYLSRC